MSGFRVVADTGLCQGHQLCQGDAPGVLNDVVSDIVLTAAGRGGDDQQRAAHFDEAGAQHVP